MSRVPFVSYAQNREDVVLARALRPDDSEGFYVDVGAGHPVYDSVTAAFAARGWRGVNVEPLVEEHALLTAARPRDVNLNVAVGAVAGVAKLFAGPAENRGSSTLVAEYAEAYREAGEDFEEREVRVRTLAQIADEHVTGPVDFLKVDVEGWEYEVLAGADWEWFRPRIVVVEATLPNSTRPSHAAWESILLAAGYCCALFDGLNRFYARSDEHDLIAALAAPANVLDDYVVHDTEERIEAATIRADAALGRLGDVEQALGEAARHARIMESRYLAAEAGVGELRDALAAANLRTAAALAAADGRVSELVALHEGVAALQREIDALYATRTFRYTERWRRRYARVRNLTRHLAS